MALQYQSNALKLRLKNAAEVVRSIPMLTECKVFQDIYGLLNISELVVNALKGEDASNLLGVVPMTYLAEKKLNKLELNDGQLYLYFKSGYILVFTVDFVNVVDAQLYENTGKVVRQRKPILKYNYATEQDFSAVQLAEAQLQRHIESYRAELMGSSTTED